MAESPKVHNANTTTLAVAGLLIDSGYADGEYLSIEPQTEDTTDKVGTDGSVVISVTNDQRATVKIKLMATSEGNARLTQLRALGRASQQGVAVGTFLLRDRLTGVQLAFAEHCWIQKPPTLSRAREVAEYEWTLRVAKMEYDFSGSV